MRRRLLFVFGFALVIGAGAILGIGMSIRTEKVVPNERPSNVDSGYNSSFENLGKTRIFFGHQSVGQNIVDGVDEIRAEDEDLCLEIVEEKEFDDSRRCILFHSKIGRNTRPESKIRAFKKIMAGSAGKDVNIALMKFCYVDINRDSDPRKVFDAYSEALAELKAKLPGTIFVHVTVPLESMPRTAEGALKHFVKRIIGRPGVIDDNTVRCRYNDLLRERYSGKEPVFDLAAVESLDDRGRMTIRRNDGAQIPFMDAQKTDDGGHLNANGRRIVAREFLTFLADVAGRLDGPQRRVE